MTDYTLLLRQKRTLQQNTFTHAWPSVSNDGIRRVTAGLHRFGIYRSKSQGQWNLLSWYASLTFFAHHVMASHLSATQCSCAEGTQDDQLPWKRDACMRFFQICGRWTPRPQRNRGCTKCWQICTIRSSDTPVSDYCCFLTLIFHKVVCWHAVRLMYIFFQIYYRVCRWKNFEIRLTVSDGKSSVYLSDSRCSVNEMDLYNSLMFYTESWLFNQINSYNVHAIITLRLLS